MTKINPANIKNITFLFLCLIVNSVISQTVKIGNQEWMKKNLDVITFRNGDTILEVKNAKDWKTASDKKQPAWCYYKYDSKNAQQYGKSYNWFAVNDKRGLAPIGWMIPSNEDCKALITFLGGSKIAGAKMQFTGAWEPPANINQDGFQVIDGVCYASNYGNGQWWTSSNRFGDENAYFFSQKNYLGEAETNWGLSNYMESVRCIRSTEKIIDKKIATQKSVPIINKKIVVTNTPQIIKEPVKIQESIVFTDPKTEKMGLKDANGKVLLPADYFTIHSMNEFGLYPASKVPGIWGFINSKGKVVIPLIYQSIGNFKDDSTTTVMKDEMMGKINTKGKVVVPIIYDMIEEELHYNQYEVSLNGKKGSVNRIGKVVVPIEFDDISIGSENIIVINRRKDDKYGLYTTDKHLQDKIIVPYKYDKIYGMSNGIFLVTLNGKYGLIGGVYAEEIIPCEKQSIRPGKIGSAPGTFIIRDGKPGYITETTIKVTKDGNGQYRKETIEIK